MPPDEENNGEVGEDSEKKETKPISTSLFTVVIFWVISVVLLVIYISISKNLLQYGWLLIIDIFFICISIGLTGDYSLQPKCPQCGKRSGIGAAFCKYCGAPLPTRCPKCGAPVSDDARFCEKCGAEIIGSVRSLRPSLRKTLRKSEVTVSDEEKISGDKIKCPFCGASINKDAEICEYCGYKIE